jgi:hypothetical protein
MTNPLIEKFEEIYGEKKEEEVVEEKKPSIDDFKDSILSGLTGGMGADTIRLNPHDCNPSLTINGGQEIMDSGMFVIPAATVNNGAISMDGSYFKPDSLISNGKTTSSVNRTPTCFAFDAPKTQMEKHFLKVLEDVANNKAVLSAISADVDTSFTGFGGQIRYTIEIVGRYP